MRLSKNSLILLIIVSAFFLAACERRKTVCAPESVTTEPALQLSDLVEMKAPQPTIEAISVEIGGKQTKVDKLVDYPLCNDEWSGTVYVSCEARVADAELDADANPLFLKGCDLKIAPNTVVYVAAHNDAAFYKGCSCHTGGGSQP